MTENIRRIGLFMIVAQTLIHFAAGQQYEKYIKIISGVIVLLLFITPFSSVNGDAVEQWQKEVERITEKIESYEDAQLGTFTDMDYRAGNSLMEMLEAEVKNNLNRELPQEGYVVTDVLIEWEENEVTSVIGTRDLDIRNVRITLGQGTRREDGISDNEDADGLIVIERIQIGEQGASDRSDAETEGPDHGSGFREDQGRVLGMGQEEQETLRRLTREYRGLCAGILGIEEEKVEVIYGGRR